MAEQIRKQKAAPAEQTTTEKVDPAKSDTALKDELDDLLDEIDSVLEENAEEFVKGYVQKGGQAVKVFLDTVALGMRGTIGRLPSLLKVWS